jgi:catecholate siderophore receptor
MNYIFRIQPTIAAVMLALSSWQVSAAETESVSDSNAKTLPEITVKASQEGDIKYQPTTNTTAAKIKASIRDIPQSIDVVPAAIIKDQGAQSLQDVLKNVPGVSFNLGDGQRDQFVIRGFDAIGDLFVDGIRDDALYYRDLSNVEQIEVLKGPASVLYGRGSSGGIINRITKKPGKEIREVAITVGAYDKKRAVVDYGDKISESASFRLVGAVEDSGSFRKQGYIERESFAPSIAFNFSEKTKMLLQLEKLRDSRVTDFGIPAFKGKPVNVKRDTYYGSRNARDDDYTDSDVTSGRATLEHQFNDNLTLRNVFGAYNYELDRNNTLVASVNETQKTASLTHNQVYRQDDGWFNQLELIQKLELAGMQHQVLYGVEIGRQVKEFKRFGWSTSTRTVSLFNPVLPTLSDYGTRNPNPNLNNVTTLEVTSVYLQDMINLSKNWKALVGARHDRFEQHVQDRRSATDPSRTDSEWSPRAGLVYQPNDFQSYYASISRSFQPSGETLNFSKEQSDLAPEETNNIEVGTKIDFFNGKLSTTAAIFNLERKNIKGTNPVNNTLIGVGTQRTKGVELTVTGELAENWQIYAGYANLDAEITKSVARQNGVNLEGNRAALTPQNSANIWLMHKLGGGFSVGGGMNYVGNRYTSPDNLVTLESYITADAVAMYQSKEYDVAFNLRNITDKEYIISGHGTSNNLNAPGAPRSAELTLTMRF